MVLLFQLINPTIRQVISLATASSVAGIKQTAVPTSLTSAKPRVPVPKSRVTSLSPTLAGRDRTLWRLKSHIGDSILVFDPAVTGRHSAPPLNDIPQQSCPAQDRKI